MAPQTQQVSNVATRPSVPHPFSCFQCTFARPTWNARQLLTQARTKQTNKQCHTKELTNSDSSLFVLQNSSGCFPAWGQRSGNKNQVKPGVQVGVTISRKWRLASLTEPGKRRGKRHMEDAREARPGCSCQNVSPARFSTFLDG